MNYKADTVTQYESTKDFSPYDEKAFLFSARIVQSYATLGVVWSINSLDLVLGLVDGFVGIIWTASGILLSNYEAFAF